MKHIPMSEYAATTASIPHAARSGFRIWMSRETCERFAKTATHEDGTPATYKDAASAPVPSIRVSADESVPLGFFRIGPNS